MNGVNLICHYFNTKWNKATNIFFLHRSSSSIKKSQKYSKCSGIVAHFKLGLIIGWLVGLFNFGYVYNVKKKKKRKPAQPGY